jgi:hypothetical protein
VSSLHKTVVINVARNALIIIYALLFFIVLMDIRLSTFSVYIMFIVTHWESSVEQHKLLLIYMFVYSFTRYTLLCLSIFSVYVNVSCD